MALTDDEKKAIVAAVEDGIIRKLREPDRPLVIAVEVAAEAADKKAPKRDPYRPALQFLTGLLAFCLTLLVALFAALNTDKGQAINALVSWVLMGMAATAVIGTIAIGLLQWGKTKSPDTFERRGKFGVGVAVVAVVAGLATVALCVRGALVVAQQHCIARPIDGIGETALAQLLVKTEGSHARAYAEEHARACFAAGDLASSAAWSKIAAALPQ